MIVLAIIAMLTACLFLGFAAVKVRDAATAIEEFLTKASATQHAALADLTNAHTTHLNSLARGMQTDSSAIRDCHLEFLRAVVDTHRSAIASLTTSHASAASQFTATADSLSEASSGLRDSAGILNDTVSTIKNDFAKTATAIQRHAEFILPKN